MLAHPTFRPARSGVAARFVDSGSMLLGVLIVAIVFLMVVKPGV